eukprot:TRINITY_DN550_c0_g3_i1.p1 TRINITY_DN550_c0_g3~~TRINITY_DN550_c0_g3_i1.p1  ORF type:complete len:421 (-),score=69.69 TRINITY_DN550_c0_g3_i1:97-1359(-)
MDPNKITLNITIEGISKCSTFALDKTKSVRTAIREVSSQSSTFIKNPEAYGLCFIDTEEPGMKRKRKTRGQYRDETRWLDDNHPLEFYKLKDQDELLLKIKNSNLGRAQLVTVAVPFLGSDDEVEFEYNYSTTVSHTILDNLRARSIRVDTVGEWKMFLPFGRKPNGQLIGLWMDYSRTLQSYSLYSDNEETEAMDDGTHRAKQLKLLIICRNLEEAKKVKVKAANPEENDHEIWWASKLAKDKLQQYTPSNAKNYQALRERVRHGIPGPLRGDVWPILSGAKEMSVTGLYQNLLQQAPVPEVSERIRRDLPRTLPNHPFFQTDEGQLQLKNVLQAYSVKTPEIGYCQGMNFIVGILLLTVSEENAFWVLNAIMDEYEMKGFFGDDVQLLGTSMMQLETCMKLQVSDIWNHLVSSLLIFS